MGSSLTVFGKGRISSLEVDTSLLVGSNISTTGDSIVGGALSVKGPAEMGGGMSIHETTNCGSSLSISELIQVGGVLIVHDWLAGLVGLSIVGDSHFGSILSVTGPTVINNSLSLLGPLHLGDFTMYADDTRMISAASNGVGCFHGTWSFETVAGTSDRRLKRDIIPLAKSLEGRSGESVEDWVLNELRPVSFVMNDGEAVPRFGFIAQEIQRVMPELIRVTEDSGEETLSVVYQDLIAVLVLVVQQQKDRIDSLETRVRETSDEIAKLKVLIEAHIKSDLSPNITV